jgi:hypothetical protein
MPGHRPPVRLQLARNLDVGKLQWLLSFPPRDSLRRIGSSTASCSLEQSCDRKRTGPQTSRMLGLRTWADTDSVVAQVDPCCPAVVARLAVLLRPAVEAELAGPQRPAEEAGKLDFQSLEEEAELAGSAVVVESLIRPAPRCPLGRVLC